MPLFIKYAISAALIVLVSEAARRSPTSGGLLASLPFVSVIAMVWLWRDTGDAQGLADFAFATFWFVLPSLTLFLVLPLLLHHGVRFPFALILSCTATGLAYFITVPIAGRFGVTL